MNQKLHFRNFIVSFFLLICSGAFAQLDNFTLSVTASDESCTANGVLNFTVANTTAGATIVFQIFQLPNTVTPIASTSQNTFTGVTAGNYRVVATQSLGNENNTQQQDVTIINTISALTYTLTGQKVVCGNDGKITVNVTNGNAVSYEIFSGPVIRPLQASNVFDLLPSGVYQIRVFDNCGESVVQSYALGALTPIIPLQNNSSYEFFSCSQIRVINPLSLNFPPNTTVAMPLTVVHTVYPPSGPPQTFTEVSDSSLIDQNIPLYYNQTYQYKITLTDACGNTVTSQLYTVHPMFTVSAATQQLGCNDSWIQVYFYGVPPYTINFLSAPPGFNPALFNSNPLGPTTGTYIIYHNDDIPLPQGFYNIQVTDACGHVATSTTTVVNQITPPNPLTVLHKRSCQLGFDTITFYNGNSSLGVVNPQLIVAPAAYPHNLPYQITGPLDDLPPGDYVIQSNDLCGNTQFTNFTAVGYQVFAVGVTILPQCNSFSINLHHSDNNAPPEVTFWLQKFNPVTGLWGNPITGNSIPFAPFNGSAEQIFNNTLNSNLTYTGSFRILKFHRAFAFPLPSPQTSTIDCVEEIYTFEYSGQPAITNVYSFSCANNVLDVVVQATGVAPLQYKITTKNGQPFVINNGTSPIFLGLEPATYNFQVQDNCGNILNSLYDISQPVSLAVTPQNLCAGQTAALTVPNFSFLTYQWWQGDNSSTILSTSNSLTFPNFNPVTQGGLYHVRIQYPNPNSCIDITLDYQMPVGSSLPNAGSDVTTSYCGSPGTLDLSTLLSGNFDPGGSWNEITSSGQLTGNFWNAGAISAGNYQFKYTVNGLCNASDEAIVNIQIKPVPETPSAFLEQTVCDGGTLNLLATTIPFGTYQWSGPNGFTSNEQNPILPNASSVLNGIYTVKSIADGCESATSSVEVTTSPLPFFGMASGCIDGRYEVGLSINNTGIDVSMLDISWSGPDNYTGSGSPIVITGGKRGMYAATVTTGDGCSVTSEIYVATTMCTIPTGVSPNNDSKNDIFDLTGFGVLKFKIYNRYGRLVFEQDDYSNQWYGQDLNGNILPDATYYYYLRLDTGQEKTGWVYVTK